MISVTGWTYDYIDEYMTLPRLGEIASYFSKQPHANESLAAILYALTGYTKEESDEDDFGKLIESQGDHGVG